MIRIVLAVIVVTSSLIGSVAFANENTLNIYTWSGVIPDFIIRQFEKETGIKVNFSTYDSNEIMYAKLKADKNPSYDIVEPSSYYIDRMRRQDMLETLDKTKLTNYKNLNPAFMHQAYDPQSSYSLPFIWGITGIFLNKDYFPSNSIKRWSDLWNTKYVDQIMLLDDSREVFSMAMRVLGYSANDSDPEHIKEAYLKLKTLLPNIKIFNSAPISILIDEDAAVGMVWNGDLFKAKKENSQLEFIYPKDGFVIWVDNFAIPKNAPHRENAYKFLDFMMRVDIAKAVALDNNFPTANLAAQKTLPTEIRDNPTVYPSQDVLRLGEFQTDIGDAALALYEKYWERLKMGG
ncbi:MAG: spermidine/putrescine ABC transporter substrate-binding protein [Gammaproteobacteria bacterium]|nr:spermidine/putrescine ABC transporter substrate-binding protein [Gammaproteobacteria bacterium]